VINPSQHKPTGMPPRPSAPKGPEQTARAAWLLKVRTMHRNKRALGLAGIVLGACMVVWSRVSADAPSWALYGGFGVLAVSWAIFIYIIIDRFLWVKKNPYKPGEPSA
jgi:hypothetical protein